MNHLSRTVGRKPTTAATSALTELGIEVTLLPYEHDPSVRSYGEEAATQLGLDPASVFKTLVVRTDAGRFVVAVVPVSTTADLKAVAAAVGDKKAQLAGEADVRRLTGYVLGGVSPIGQRTALPTVLDESALDLPTVYVSGGRRGLDIGISPDNLRRATEAVVARIAVVRDRR